MNAESKPTKEIKGEVHNCPTPAQQLVAMHRLRLHLPYLNVKELSLTDLKTRADVSISSYTMMMFPRLPRTSVLYALARRALAMQDRNSIV